MSRRINNAEDDLPSPYRPYTTPNHSVSKGRYITSSDPRGYVPVYEYPLNNQWIMMDADDGYVLWTGIWKALGNSKADVLRMIEAQPELASQLRRVRGGYLKIQGTWLPFEVALRLARRVAWPIREDLVPLFGPTFPASCLPPDQPGFGQPIENLQKRKHRRAQLPIPSSSSSVNGGRSTPPGQAGPDRVYKPYSPTAASNADSPVYENLGQDQNHFRYGGSGGDITPSSTPGPYYGHPTPSSTYDRSAAEERSRTTSASSNSGRLRYAPYPATSPGQEMVNPSSASYQQHLHQPHNRHRPPSIPILQEPFPASRPAESTQRTDLPSIATFDLGSPGPSATAFALPRIGSIRDMVSRPEMDASTVLRRLKLKDEQDRVSARTGSRGLLQQRQESQQQATGTYPVSRDEAYYQLYRPQSPSPAGDDGSRPSPLYSHQGSPPARRRGSPTTTFGDAPPPGDVAAKGWPGAAVPLYYPGSPAVGRGGSGTSQHPLRPW